MCLLVLPPSAAQLYKRKPRQVHSPYLTHAPACMQVTFIHHSTAQHERTADGSRIAKKCVLVPPLVILYDLLLVLCIHYTPIWTHGTHAAKSGWLVGDVWTDLKRSISRWLSFSSLLPCRSVGRRLLLWLTFGRKTNQTTKCLSTELMRIVVGWLTGWRMYNIHPCVLWTFSVG